jgi:hypothetical protein
MRLGTRGFRPAAAAAVLLPALLPALFCAPGCDTSWSFDAKSDNVEVQGHSQNSALTAGPFALESRDGLPRTARPGGEVVLAFSRALDPRAARDAVRVEDETRGRAPVPVDVEVRGRDLVLRPRRGAGDWRPGAILAVRVAGLPSLAALRSEGGETLPEDAEVRVLVRAPRRTDRVAPVLTGSEPAEGASGVDPAAPVVLRFSEPMDARAFSAASRSQGSTGEVASPVLVTAAGSPVACRAWLDRSRTELTVLPEIPFPPGADVEIEITDRVRDANGNRLGPSSTRRLSFSTAEVAAADGAGRLVEAFEDRDRLDPLGTTVRWDDPAARGVLAGVVEPVALEVGAAEPGESIDAALLLDPRGGSLRLLLTPADLGGEPRVLKGLQVFAAPGSAPGEILEPAVRLAPAAGIVPPDLADADDLPWQTATEALRGATARGAEGAFSLPFRHPVAWTGTGAMLVEVSWRGIAGRVILRAARHEDFRCATTAAGLEPALLRTAPVLRVETVGERAVARSRWMDAGRPASWLEPRVRPAPDASRAVIQVQGAPSLPRGAAPDPGRATPWTQDPSALEGMQWIRFRVLFPDGEPGSPPAAIDEIAMPFAAK